jgi:hypothetical protein
MDRINTDAIVPEIRGTINFRMWTLNDTERWLFAVSAASETENRLGERASYYDLIVN